MYAKRHAAYAIIGSVIQLSDGDYKARQPMARHTRAAFTLVELLIVIGIIALLISILLPTLAKARESANRAVCLSHLRQQYIANQMYALDNRDAIPIGHNCRKGIGQLLWDAGYPVGSNPRYLQQGLLISAKYITDPKFFYCPSEKNPWFRFNTPENPWTPVPTRWGIFGGYTSRPLAEWSDNGNLFANTPALYYPPYGRRYMRLGWMKPGMAMLADSFADTTQLRDRHGSGINVAFADGSARWIDTKAPLKSVWQM